MKTSLFVLLLSVGLCVARERGLPPQQGIANFGKINDSLFRGAQPDAFGITPGLTGPLAALHAITTLSICGMISKRQGDSPRFSPSASIEHLGSESIWMVLPV
jgi:hypothetical protein